MSVFQKAIKKGSFLRMAIIGPSGSGKSYTSLILASSITKLTGGEIAAIDTEHGSLKKYADQFDFSVVETDTFSIPTYINLIKEAERNGFKVLIIDSLSHAWFGKEGALETVEKVATRMKTSNTFAAWKEVTPLQNQLIDTILASNMHIIATMRSKTEYIIESNDKGRMSPKKIGLAPIQREGVEYEFDIVAEMTIDNNMIITKTRDPELANSVIEKPTGELAVTILKWLGENPNTSSTISNIPKKMNKKDDEANKITTKLDTSSHLNTNATDFLSDEEAKQLWEIAKKSGHTTQSAKDILKNVFGINSFKTIPRIISKNIEKEFSEPVGFNKAKEMM